MTVKRIAGRVLTAFLLVSVGVAIGKELALRGVGESGGAATTASGGPGVSKVMVYYMHGTPCLTCTMVETAARRVVAESFGPEVAAGTMEFASVDYLSPANHAWAERFEVGENMVIAVRLEDGVEVARARLDGVMALATDGEGLAAYLQEGIGSVVGRDGR